jgi:hypothetical protein
MKMRESRSLSPSDGARGLGISPSAVLQNRTKQTNSTPQGNQDYTFSEHQFCTKCGKKNEIDANFCAKCGTKLAGKVPDEPVDYGFGAHSQPMYQARDFVKQQPAYHPLSQPDQHPHRNSLFSVGTGSANASQVTFARRFLFCFVVFFHCLKKKKKKIFSF